MAVSAAEASPSGEPERRSPGASRLGGVVWRVGARGEPRRGILRACAAVAWVIGQPVVALVREPAARLEAVLHEVLQPLDDALGLRVARLAPACSPDWRSQTSFCGSAPNDHTQRPIPNSRS